MTSEVLTVTPDTTMAELLNFMTKHHHMGYPIVDEGGDLLGIATFEDVMKTDPDERTKTNVGTVKQKKLFTVFPKDTALKAYEKMVQNKVGRVLVVDPKNPKKVAGIITKTDIMQILRWPMKTK